MLPDTELFPLQGDSLRNWLRTAGQMIFTEFDTGIEALDFLRLNGAAIRTSDFYDIRREVLATHTYTDMLLTYPDNQLIPAAWHVADHGLDLSTDYLYRFKVFGEDPGTGDEITSYFAISSDRQLSPGQAKDLLGSMIVGEADFYEIVVSGIEMDSALVRPGVFG